MRSPQTASCALHVAILLVVVSVQSACTTTIGRIQQWERSGDVAKLSAVATSKKQPAFIRKKALESLARLNWRPSNSERLDVYGTFASRSNYAEAAALMQALGAGTFAEIDAELVACAGLLSEAGGWTDSTRGRALYGQLRVVNGKAVASGHDADAVRRRLTPRLRGALH